MPLGGQYILSDTHVLALNSTGYFSSNPNPAVPIVQPHPGDAFAQGYISCPPTATQVANISVGSLQTVLPINFGGTTIDASLARAFSGEVQVQQFGISTFSNIPTGSNGHNIVHRGMLLQSSGGFTGLHKGWVTNAIAIPRRVKFRTHIQTTHTRACPQQTTYVANTIEVSAGLGNRGDSGSMVFTQDPCPQPVGLVVSKDTASGRVLVEELTPVISALTSAGNFSSLTMVASGCTPTTSQVQSNSTYESDVDSAMQTTSSLQSYIVSKNVPYEIGVGVDMTTTPARLDVVADNGTVVTFPVVITDAAYVDAQLQADGLADSSSPTGLSYQGIPVEVSTVIEFDETNSVNFNYGN